jgi:hypothetical protein
LLARRSIDFPQVDGDILVVAARSSRTHRIHQHSVHDSPN